MGVHGPQRTSRFAVSHPPRTAPWRLMTVSAYSLHLGVNRQWAPIRRESVAWYHRMADTATRVATWRSGGRDRSQPSRPPATAHSSAAATSGRILMLTGFFRQNLSA